jgi:hypothetical protein
LTDCESRGGVVPETPAPFVRDSRAGPPRTTARHDENLLEWKPFGLLRRNGDVGPFFHRRVCLSATFNSPSAIKRNCIAACEAAEEPQPRRAGHRAVVALADQPSVLMVEAVKESPPMLQRYSPMFKGALQQQCAPRARNTGGSTENCQPNLVADERLGRSKHNKGRQ